MAILHPRAERQMASNGVARSRRPACTTVWGVTPLRMPTNGLGRDSNLGVVHEVNEPYPLNQAPIG